MCVFSGLIYIDIIILLRRIDRNLEKTLESALDCKEIKPLARPPDAKSSLIGKDPNAGKD